ncbi:cyclin-dependent kinase 4 inhibitor B-like isoform X1 [Lepisosteus oculatus]|uniref:cyclin-dependent kinase 4 inhibitor B-like isoform X1 n=1 Tax=Lepisosteus oculatus TaxID=7918 RepID=UPI0035F529E1
MRCAYTSTNRLSVAGIPLELRFETRMDQGAPHIKISPFSSVLECWKLKCQVMMMGNTSVARLLLLYGANPNLQDVTTGMTPLHDAASGGFLDTVMILDQYHADRNITDNFNRRPVDLAKANGHEDVVDFLES